MPDLEHRVAVLETKMNVVEVQQDKHEQKFEDVITMLTTTLNSIDLKIEKFISQTESKSATYSKVWSVGFPLFLAIAGAGWTLFTYFGGK